MFFLGIFASLYLYNSTQMHNATEIQELGGMMKVGVSYYLVEMFLLIWILYLYNGKKIKKLFYVSLIIILFSLIINLILPQGLIFKEVENARILSFNWVGSYTILQGKPNWFYEYLAVLFYFTTLAFMILSFFRLIKERKEQKAIVFSILTSIFLFVGIYDVLVDLEIINGIYLTEMFMLPIILLLNFDIVYELRAKNLIESKFEKAERNYETMVDQVQLLVLGISPQGLINFINPFFLKISQYRSDELIGKDFMKIFIPECCTS